MSLYTLKNFFSKNYVLLLLPIGLIVGIGFGIFLSLLLISPDIVSGFRLLFEDVSFKSALMRTFRVAMSVALISTILAYPSSMFIYGIPSRMLKRIALALVWLPVMVNPVIRGYGWMIVLGRYGMINTLLSYMKLGTVKLLYTETAIVMGLVELFTPFMIMALYSSLNNINEETVYAARTLGSSGFRLFLDLILPLTFPGYVFGLTIVIAGCFTAYTTPVLLGGPKNMTLSMLLYEYAAIFLDWRKAVALALFMLFLVLTLTSIPRIFLKEGRRR